MEQYKHKLVMTLANFKKNSKLRPSSTFKNTEIIKPLI